MVKPIHQPILNVYINWHPDAESRCQPLAAALYASLYQDPQKPFARGIFFVPTLRVVTHPPTLQRCGTVSFDSNVLSGNAGALP